MRSKESQSGNRQLYMQLWIKLSFANFTKALLELFLELWKRLEQERGSGISATLDLQ